MAFIKDDDMQIKLEQYPNGIISILVRDRATRKEVRLGYVQGRQHKDKKGDWVSAPPDMFLAEKVRDMVHRTLRDIQELT